MKKISWITSNSFIDVDLPILKSICSEDKIEVNWHLIFLKNRVNDYEPIKISRELERRCVKLSYLYLEHRLRSLFSFFKLLELLLMIRKQKSDVIYINAELDPYLSFLTWTLFQKRKIIVAVHDVEPHIGVSKIFHLLLYFKLLIFKNFHVFSTSQRKIFEKKFERKNIFEIPLFLQDFGYSDMRPNEDKVNFLFFGSIRENKGLEYLIAAANKLDLVHLDNFQINIAGNCNNWEQYEKLILNADRFEINIAAIQNERIADIFSKAHYLVLPYKDITQSGPLMLAFNYNIIPIASKLPGFIEHIQDRETGFLFESENSESLFFIMNQIIKNHQNDYERLKRNLSEYTAVNYSIKDFKFRYLKMFSSF